MNFFSVTEQEISALTGLPHVQQVTYLLGIKPYMDRQTAIVGVKRRISYQSLAEALYVEPHQGIQSGSPSRQQLRRVIKSLERGGLIEVQSDDKHLILKCRLASSDNSVQNKADTNPTPQADTKPTQGNSVPSSLYEVRHQKSDIGQIAKADTPHKRSNNYIFLLSEKFETFWSLYPEKKSKHKAQAAFEQLNPDDPLFQQMTQALQRQTQHFETMQLSGAWVPPWKYPANWLTQRCWEDELEETQHAKHKTTTGTRDATRDLFSPPSESPEPTRNNVIELQGRR
jgi:hypothetical protein